MKTAIIYTGHLRTWEQCLPNQLANLYPDEYKTFWHTYEPMGSVIPYEYYPHSDVSEFDSNKAPETNPSRVQNVLHNLFVSFSLVPNNYDCYVKCRPDIVFSGKVDLKNEANTIYIPEGQDYRGINDQFAFGNYKAMKWYYDLYLYYKDYWKEGVMFSPEGFLLHHLNKGGLNIVRIPVTNNIIRN